MHIHIHKHVVLWFFLEIIIKIEITNKKSKRQSVSNLTLYE